MNTFLIYDTKRQRVELVTSSARTAQARLRTGTRVDVWSGYDRAEVIYTRTAEKMQPYVAAEKEYHRQKQEAAERRNKGDNEHGKTARHINRYQPKNKEMEE